MSIGDGIAVAAAILGACWLIGYLTIALIIRRKL